MRPIVAFHGDTGAFSEAAAEHLVPGEITLFPCPTFDATVRAVVNGLRTTPRIR
ncbi:MAG: prephenate dehydratase domain-containing protein [bacterium]